MAVQHEERLVDHQSVGNILDVTSVTCVKGVFEELASRRVDD